MQLSIVPASELTPTQYAGLVRVCSDAFETDYRDYLRHFPDPVHVLACEGDEVVSHALWVTRWLQPGTLAPQRTAYVEGVATAPERQGCGYGSAVMRLLGAALLTRHDGAPGAETQYTLAALATESFSFYARFGWVRWYGPGFVRTESGVKPAPTEALMVLRLSTTPAIDTAWSISCEARTGDCW